jgi:signal transduction histidine kinase/PAS domain-containing protein
VNQGNLDWQLQQSQAQVQALLSAALVESSLQPQFLAETLTKIAETLAALEAVVGAEPSVSEAQTAQPNQDWFDWAPSSYLVTDRNGKIQAANSATAVLFRRSSESIVELYLHDFLADSSISDFEQLLAQLQHSKATLTTEVSLKSPADGANSAPSNSAPSNSKDAVFANSAPLQVILSGNTQWNSEHQAVALRWLLVDITMRKQSEMLLQQRVEQEQLIGAIARRIRQSLDPQEILKNTVAEVKQFLQADRVVVYRIEPTGIASVVAEAVDPPWVSLLGVTIDQTLTVQRLDLYRGQAFSAIEDVEQFPSSPETMALLALQQVRAALVTPIVQADQLLGLLCAHQCVSPRDWQPFEGDLLHQLAGQVAIALQQSKLYQQAQQLNADLEQEVQRRTDQVQRALDFESMLKRITDKVRDSLDESQILQAAVRELTLVLGLSGCNAALYDLDQGISTIRYDYTHSIPTSQGKVAQMDHFPEIYSQLQQGYYFQFCSLIPNPLRGHVAMLACPIFVDPNSSQGVDQAVLGDLWLINYKDYVFTEFEIRLVQQVANQCAIAIRQARLFQAAEAQVQELEKLNRLKDDFLSTVSHELRTPISNVKMAIHMLKMAPDEDRRQRYLHILETESSREAELINDLLDLQRLEISSYPITLETILLEKWLPGLVEPFKSRIAHHQQIFQVDCPSDLQPVTSDISLLRRILAELLNNACKYTAGEHCIILGVTQEHEPSVTPSRSATIFTLRNQADIPSAELPNIFEKFYRIPHADPWKQGGTGLGLALVQKLVERLYGTIEVESIEGWTTFRVQIPTRPD